MGSWSRHEWLVRTKEVLNSRAIDSEDLRVRKSIAVLEVMILDFIAICTDRHA